MPETDAALLTPVREAHRFDQAALAAYLRGRLPGVEHGLEVLQFEGGQSNPTYRLTAGSQLYVLRGKEQISVSEVGPGDIGAVAKLVETATGDTLADPSRKVVLDGVEFPKPLFSASVMPRRRSRFSRSGAWFSSAG